jgi:hypothetical protein
MELADSHSNAGVEVDRGFALDEPATVSQHLIDLDSRLGFGSEICLTQGDIPGPIAAVL